MLLKQVSYKTYMKLSSKSMGDVETHCFLRMFRVLCILGSLVGDACLHLNQSLFILYHSNHFELLFHIIIEVIVAFRTWIAMGWHLIRRSLSERGKGAWM